MTLYEGRPADCTGRAEKEVRVYDLLDALGMQYQRVDHEPVMTMEACSEADRTLACTVCKNLLLCTRKQRECFLVLLPGDKALRAGELARRIGAARLSFAPAERMEAYLDTTPGALSVLGLMNDRENKVQLVIDRELLEGESIGFHPCVNTSTLRLRTAELLEKFLPAVRHSPLILDLE